MDAVEVLRFRDQAGSVPLITVKPHVQAAIHGSGIHVSAQIIEGETAVRCIGMNHANNVRDRDATVLRVKLGSKMARHVQPPVDLPATVRPARHLWSFGVDGARGDDLYFACERLRVLAACVLRNDPRL